jgi:predicted TIM-barrel fold metal-dependent hydrolase
MSFGFSIGDLIGAANLTYTLIKALQGSHDAGDDYRAAVHELGCMQQAFIQVSCLGANQKVSQATFASAAWIVMGAMEIIQKYLDKTKKYDQSLGGLRTSGIRQNLRKVGWTLYKADEMKKLRETLHARLSSLSVLLAAANLYVEEYIPSEYSLTLH